MITAVDTSVLLDVFTAAETHLTRSQAALRTARQEGQLVICDVVLAELRPFFRRRQALEAALFQTLAIDYLPVDRDAALLAGDMWSAYRAAGGPRDRLIADFLVAAHAKTTADRLLTRDRGFYRNWFTGLRLLEP